MKRLLAVSTIAAGLFLAGSAQATPITGAISVSGGVVPVYGNTGLEALLGSATALDFLAGNTLPTPGVAGIITVMTSSGDLAAFPYDTKGTIIDLSLTGSNFGTNYLAPPITGFEIISGGFAFDLATLAVTYQDDQSLSVYGTGTMYLTGFDPTPGIFLYTNQGVRGSYSFSATNASVPDAGSSLLLMGLGLAGLGVWRKRLG